MTDAQSNPKSQERLDLATCHETVLAALVESITPERLTSYRGVAQGQRQALMLYELNARLSNSLHELIGAFEIALRNQVSSCLSGRFGEHWYRDAALAKVLHPNRLANLQDARDRLTRERKTITTGRVVAALSFHFWEALHESRYRDSLWTPCLRFAWPKGTNVKELHADLKVIRNVRNRVAHHEPVFARRWRSSEALLWARLHEAAPVKHAWLSGRLAHEFRALEADLCRFD